MYRLLKSVTGNYDIILEISNNTFIPNDPLNRDYQQYLKWLDGYELVNGEYVKTAQNNVPLQD